MRSTRLLLLLSAFCATAAQAEERVLTTVLVMSGPTGDPSAVPELRDELLTAFEDDLRVALHDPFQPSEGDPQEAPVAALVERGQRHLTQGRAAEAVQELQRAVAQLKAAPLLAPRATFVNATVHLAAAQVALGRRAPALATLKALLVWRPQADLRLADAPPGWDDVVVQAREWFAAAPVGALLVTSVPPRAMAYLDGRRLGPTPVVAGNLTGGTHYVTLRAEGYQRTLFPAEVQGGVERTAAATLRSLPELAPLVAVLERLRGALGSPSLPERDELQLAVGTPQVLIVVVDGIGATLDLQGFLYDLDRNRLVRRTTLRVTRPLRAPDLAPLALWGPPPAPPPPPPRVWYRRWWVWALTGAAATTAAVAITRAAQGSPAPVGEALQIRW